jgi:mutator protein MutT
MSEIPTVEVAAAVIREGGRYLITQRAEGSHLAGLWEFPGGKRKPGESLEECLKRELREELGVEIEVGERLDTVTWPYPERTVVLHFFSCALAGGTIAPQEGQAVCWVPPEEFSRYSFPPADATLVARLQADRKEVWASGDAYEPYVGRWSRLVAREFIAWLDLPTGLHWLDLGCGTGALSQVILEGCSPLSLVGLDSSDGYIAYARAHVADSRAHFRRGNAQALPCADGEFDAAVAGLVLNFVPDKARVLAEKKRVVRAGGTVAAYVWDYAGEMQLMRFFWDAAVALDPAALELDEGRRFPIAKPGPLSELFTEAGLREVEVRAIDVPTVFKDFDDYWTPFLGGQAPAPGYCMSLPEQHRGALRERIRASLPVRADDTIHLIARAWAVKGRVP